MSAPTLTAPALPATEAPRIDGLRIALWAALIGLALFFLGPLYVMLSTSLKSMDEIRQGKIGRAHV